MALVGVCLLAQPTYANATSASDRASTHTFLQATYTFDLELVRNNPKTNAALDRAAAAIAAECPKVLAGAPGALFSSSPVVGVKQLSPHALGEADRHGHQYQDLNGELEAALHSAAFQTDSQALANFAATVTPLSWSNPAIAPAVQFELSLVRAILAPGTTPAGVCADMRSWVASGYQRLSSGTRTFQTQQEDLFESSLPLGTSSEALLEPYEGPSERSILLRREALPTPNLLELSDSATTKLHKQLGIEDGSTAGISSEFSRSKTFGRGHTHTGLSYKVEASKGYGPRCPHIVTVSVTTPVKGGSLTSSSSNSLRCLSGKRPAARPQVTCDEGVLQIESSTVAQTRHVRLTLSSGHTIVSSVTLVPRKYGGPAGVYFQTLRGPSPYPVSLSELDAAGRVTRTVALRVVKDCHLATPKPTFGQIVNEKSPSGQGFTIVGYSNDEHGHHTVSLDAEGPAFAPGDGEDSPPEEPTPAHTKYFSWQLSLGCEPHPFALVYGQLIAPGTSVLVATATTPLAPLTQAKIPAALEAPGTLAYSLTPGLPTELVVMSATGTTLAKEDLTAAVKSETEYCEGYAEPTG
jgi:hypothetical protein